MSKKLIFGGLIVVALLLIYVYLIWEALGIEIKCDPSTPGACALGSQVAQVLAGIGGLISAVVVAELAQTPSFELPRGRVLAGLVPPGPGDIISGIATIYVLVWLITGLATFYVGVIKYPDKVKEVTALGNAWLGAALGAAYAYFGVTKPAP